MTGDINEDIAAMIDNAEIVDSGCDDVPPGAGADADHVDVACEDDLRGDVGSVSQIPPVDLDVVRLCAPLDQNDTDNGRRLISHFGSDLLFVREVGPHVWCGTHWNPDGGQEAVERFSQEVARRIKLEVDEIRPGRRDAALIAAGTDFDGLPLDSLTDEQREALREFNAAEARLARRREGRYKFAVSCGNRARTMAMIAQAVPHRSIPPSALDTDPMRFNLLNGTLRFVREVEDVDDPECPDPDARRVRRRVRVGVRLEPHDRAALIAKIAPIRYDRRARCRKFLRFLRRMQPDRTLRRFLQTAVGRALIGGAKTQVLVFLYGDGANGKSVFMEVVAELLGGYGGRLKPESISGSVEGRGDQATPDMARLAGKRFVAIAELPRGAPLREGLVKTMTGGEPTPVRHLNKGFFDLMPEFIPFMSGNDLPDVGGLDHGIWRRLKFVHWPVTISEGEKREFREMVDELLAEAPGILNWAIEGALRFLREGLRDPPAVVALTQAHRSDLDPVEAFIKACVRPKPGAREGDGVQAREMYLAFEAYCDANAIRAWKEKSFSLALKKKGLVRKDDRIRRWVGVELHDVPRRTDDRRGSDSSQYAADLSYRG